MRSGDKQQGRGVKDAKIDQLMGVASALALNCGKAAMPLAAGPAPCQLSCRCRGQGVNAAITNPEIVNELSRPTPPQTSLQS
jgi:hypothetical protein